MDRMVAIFGGLPRVLVLLVLTVSVAVNVIQYRTLVRWQAASSDLEISTGSTPDGKTAYTIRRGDRVVCMFTGDAESEDYLKAWGSDIGGSIGREDVNGDGTLDAGVAELQMMSNAYTLSSASQGDGTAGKTTLMVRDRAADAGIVSIYEDSDGNGEFDVWRDRRAGKSFNLVEGTWTEAASATP